MTKWILFVHVLSAMWLATGAFGGAIARAQGRRALDLPGKVAALRMGWRLASIFAIPGSIFAGLTGLSLLDPMGFGFRPGWVHASLAIWLVILGLGLLYLAPRAKRMLAAAEESLAAGAPNDELKRLASSKLARALADLPALGVVALVLLMVVKPF
jgi:uncharacterized membrane protein